MSDQIVIQIIIQLGTIAAAIVAAVAARSGKAKAGQAHAEAQKAAKGVAAVQAETQTNHGSSLRDAINRIEDNQKTERQARVHLEVAVEGVASDVRGVRRDIGRLQDADANLRNEVASVARGLESHLDDVPAILDKAFSDHAHDCPVRTPRTRK